MYREVKGDIWPVVNLHKSVKSSGMNESNVIKLLTIAHPRLFDYSVLYLMDYQDVAFQR